MYFYDVHTSKSAFGWLLLHRSFSFIRIHALHIHHREAQGFHVMAVLFGKCKNLFLQQQQQQKRRRKKENKNNNTSDSRRAGEAQQPGFMSGR